MSLLLEGLLIGFSIAAPVGPIGLLCIRGALTDGRMAGFVSGLGAATADAVYGAIAALGLTEVTHVLMAGKTWLQLGGGMFLIYLGVTTVVARRTVSASAKTRPEPDNKTRHRLAAYGTTFALTLANPMTILSFAGIFAGLGLGADRGHAGAAWVIGGVFLGSAAWWLILAFAAAWLGARLQHGGLRAINWFSGALIGGFGLWFVAESYSKF